MKLKIIKALFFVMIPFWVCGQNSYKLLFKTNNHEIITHLFYENSENFIAVLQTYNTPNKYIVKETIFSCNINNKDDTLRWPVKLWRSDTSLRVGAIVRDNDQNFIIAGNGVHYYDYDSIISRFHWIIKLDQNKNIIYEKMYNKPDEIKNLDFNTWLHLLYTKQGNYLYAERLSGYIPTSKFRTFFMLINPDGDTIKTKVSKSFAEIQALTYNHDSSAILMHESGQPIPNCDDTDGALVLDTTNFDVIDGFCYYEDANWEMISGVFDAKLISNGDLIVAGDGSAGYPPGVYLSIFKYDTNYNLIKIAHLTDPDTSINPGWAENIAINKEEKIFVTGSFDNALGLFPEQYCWVYVAKLDTGLNLINERYFGGDASYDVYSLTATDDGGIAVCGYRYDYLTNEPNEGDAFIIKFNPDLWVNIPDNLKIPIHNAIVYPNPGKEYLKIRTTIKNSDFKLFNASGKLILTKNISDLVTEINTKHLLKGTYYWIIYQNEKTVDNGKWIKL